MGFADPALLAYLRNSRRRQNRRHRGCRPVLHPGYPSEVAAPDPPPRPPLLVTPANPGSRNSGD